MFSERQVQLIKSVAVWKSGAKEGLPTNERLRELRGMLSKYRYGPAELDMIEAEITGATPPRILKRARKEGEGVR